MKLLLIIISLLKAVGIIILVLLLIALALAVLLLLSGISYEASGYYKDGQGSFGGCVSYLFGLVRAEFAYERGRGEYKLKIPFLKAYKAHKARAEIKRAKKELEMQGKTDKAVTAMSKPEPDPEPADMPHIKPKSKAEAIKDRLKSLSPRKRAAELINGVKQRLEGIKTGIKRGEDITERAGRYYKEYGSELKALYKPLKRLIKRLLRAVGIKRAKGDIAFGFDDPSLTGVALGAACAAVAYAPSRLSLNLKGCFEGACLDINMDIKGKTNMLSLSVPVVSAVLERPVLRLIKKLKG